MADPIIVQIENVVFVLRYFQVKRKKHKQIFDLKLVYLHQVNQHILG